MRVPLRKELKARQRGWRRRSSNCLPVHSPKSIFDEGLGDLDFEAEVRGERGGGFERAFERAAENAGNAGAGEAPGKTLGLFLALRVEVHAGRTSGDFAAAHKIVFGVPDKQECGHFQASMAPAPGVGL